MQHHRLSFAPSCFALLRQVPCRWLLACSGALLSSSAMPGHRGTQAHVADGRAAQDDVVAVPPRVAGRRHTGRAPRLGAAGPPRPVRHHRNEGERSDPWLQQPVVRSPRKHMPASTLSSVLGFYLRTGGWRVETSATSHGLCAPNHPQPRAHSFWLEACARHARALLLRALGCQISCLGNDKLSFNMRASSSGIGVEL